MNRTFAPLALMAQGFLSWYIFLANQQLLFRVEIEWYQYQFVITKAQVVAFVENHVVAISRDLYQNYFH